jgi:hypothetical protein
VHQTRVIADDSCRIADGSHGVFKAGLTTPIDNSVWMGADVCNITANRKLFLATKN